MRLEIFPTFASVYSRGAMSIAAIFIISLASVMINAQTTSSRAKLIGNNIAVFYPKGFEAGLTLPSLALQSEPVETDDVPADWTLRPVFREFSGRQIAELYAGRNVSLYGTGEVTGPLQRNGKEIKLWNTDNFMYQYDSTRLYQSHPWVMGVRANGTAFGIIADHSYPQRIVLHDTIRFESEGPAFRMIVMERNSPQEVMAALGQLTGNMPLPPIWALGYQQCRWSYKTADRVREVAAEFRTRKIPCDVIWMDIDYMDGFRIFTFDKTAFPDPRKLNADLHKINFKAVWMIDPGVKVDTAYKVYKSGTKDHHWVLNADGHPYEGDVWPGPCHFPDFTRPETQKWWAQWYHDYMATGIDGVWNDMNEPAVFNGPDKTMPLTNYHRGGGTLPPGLHNRYHNVYGLLMVRSSREGLLNATPNKRPFILSRSNFLGGHRYAATWTGDNAATWEHLKLSIPMSLTLSLSGQPFNGPDIGGFALNPSPDLFAHWIALGAFYPFSRGHACEGTIDKEPWAFGPEVETVARTAMNRRYRLLPYLYTLFYEASQTNLPVMRPVFFADSKDTSLREEQQAFLLGNDLLVVPRWAKNAALPKHFSRVVTLAGELPTDKYQPVLYQKDGSIIPLTHIIQSTADYDAAKLELLLSPDADGKATGTVYIDGGDGFDYQKGDCALLQLEAQMANHTIDIAVTRTAGNRETDINQYRVFVNANGQMTEARVTEVSANRLTAVVE